MKETIVASNKYSLYVKIAHSYMVSNKNSEFKPVKLRLKIDLVSYPTRAEGLVNSIKYSN